MRETARLRSLYVANDLLTSFAGILAFDIIRWLEIPAVMRPWLAPWLFLDPHVAWSLVLVPIMMISFFALSGFYNNVTLKSRLDDMRNSLLAALAGTLVVYFAAMIDDYQPHRIRNYELIAVLWLCLWIPVYIGRSIITALRRRQLRRAGGIYRCVIVGNEEDADRMRRRLDPGSGRSIRMFDVAARISPEDVSTGMQPIVDTICPQAIIVMPATGGIQASVDLLGVLLRYGINVYVPLELYNLITSRTRITNIVSEPLINISQAHIPCSTANIKRVSDIVVSATALLLLSPVYAAIALAVKLGSKGPVFYRQTRIGRYKRPFNIIKFRTMVPDAEAEGPQLSRPDDPRITPIGTFLRKYRLDELPQFYNVLRGDMSLVGPRPEREHYVNRIIERVPYYTLVHQVRPGITSWGMVKYGYASDIDQMIERLPYDLLYIENMSFGVDMKILFHTVATVLTGKGL